MDDPNGSRSDPAAPCWTSGAAPASTRAAGPPPAPTSPAWTSRRARSTTPARRPIRDGLPIHYVEADYLAWQPDRTFDLVTMIWCDFSALGRPADCARLLASVRDLAFAERRVPVRCPRPALPRLAAGRRAPGGASAGRLLVGGSRTRRPSRRSSTRRSACRLDRHEIAEADRTWTVWNWVQAYDPASLAGLLGAAGLDRRCGPRRRGRRSLRPDRAGVRRHRPAITDAHPLAQGVRDRGGSTACSTSGASAPTPPIHRP